jgi:cell division protein FtsL
MKNYEIELNKQNLDELFSERKIFLMRQTLLNILSAKGIIYTYYKNKQLTKGNYAQRKSKYNS